MENAIQLLKNQLTSLNYSPLTVHNYATVVERLCKHCSKQPHQINENDYKSFVDFLITDLNFWGIYGNISK